ncbi:MAG: hypothetical protein COT89_02185 [Candidatus Colwellbacteria bacterium CG10_big_fil_rev_8_21_14_0_10_42_22]|uniref:Uncharacterized protein n=1 Tax=Candidatus Colwellbacteria bacterium CG10_big_fil_rev_8_21_14_0_10_42_22 TaxID=1974540 RepID=A0A2H0VFH0_9BACT|nr:MAG: hypothetical protein COT89_02185 [Candidatus Colwellbacteria bacterium CG10_big_fil_rev_8_21_14_0_10_42_22]
MAYTIRNSAEPVGRGKGVSPEFKDMLRRLGGGDFAHTIEAHEAWEGATPIRGRFKGRFRRDPNGHIIHWPSFGKDTKYGWEIRNGMAYAIRS